MRTVTWCFNKMARVAFLGQRFTHALLGLKFRMLLNTAACSNKYFAHVSCVCRDHQKYYHPFCLAQDNHVVQCFGENRLGGNSSQLCWVGLRNRSMSTGQESGLDHVTYEKVVGETLENLTEFFESLDELDGCPQEFDVQYADGVLTVSLGSQHGTYVINKQTPNKQIWLSSPTSGPKRYDFLNGRWVYSHDGKALHDLLNEEFSAIFNQKIDFTPAENKS